MVVSWWLFVSRDEVCPVVDVVIKHALTTQHDRWQVDNLDDSQRAGCDPQPETFFAVKLFLTILHLYTVNVTMNSI